MSASEHTTEHPVRQPVSPEAWRRFGAILVIVALWGAIAPYSAEALGLELNTRDIVEVVDHVVPGVIAIAIAGYATATKRMPLLLALVLVLAGFWMLATHVPLLKQGFDGQVEWATALWHSMPGVLLFALSAITAVLAWSDAE